MDQLNGHVAKPLDQWIEDGYRPPNPKAVSEGLENQRIRELDCLGEGTSNTSNYSDYSNPSNPSLTYSDTSNPSDTTLYEKSFWESLVAVARQTPVPECAKHLLNPKIRLLSTMCLLLQRNAGDKDFYFSSYVAGPLLDVFQPKAHRFFMVLCHHRIISKTHRGGKKQANRYRFIGGRNP
jgi:hypothetical protein